MTNDKAMPPDVATTRSADVPAGDGAGYSGQEAPAAAASDTSATARDPQRAASGADRRDLPPEAGHREPGKTGTGEVHGSGAGAGGGNPGEDYDSDSGGSDIVDQSRERSR